LRTTILGRAAFLAVLTITSLSLLRARPQDPLPHLILFFECAFGIAVCGGRAFYAVRTPYLLLLSCLTVGLVNALMPPHEFSAVGKASALYGAARASSFASLAFSSLLVAILTRPSDLARFFAVLGASSRTAALFSIPMVTLNSMRATLESMLIAQRVSFRSFVAKPIDTFVQLATAMLAITLTRALHLFQVAESLDRSSKSQLRFQPRLVSLYDLMLLGLLLPPFLPQWISDR